jgi:hypothetical protein
MVEKYDILVGTKDEILKFLDSEHKFGISPKDKSDYPYINNDGIGGYTMEQQLTHIDNKGGYGYVAWSREKTDTDKINYKIIKQYVHVI